MRIIFLLILVALVAVEARLWILWRLHGRKVKMLTEMKEELDKMWNRIEWLCRDVDDRLELQQKSKQVRNLWKRLRYVEKRLYIEPSDAFKEKEEDGE
jgi:hypothetical protein